MKNKQDFESLSRREREVMYVVHQHGCVSAELIHQSLTKDISYSGARRYLSILEEKGFLSMKKEGNRYLYSPAESSTEVGISILKRAFGSFFKGSPAIGIANFVETEGKEMSKDELLELENLIKEARKQHDEA